MLITDTNHTFAIFNYDDIQWYASTTLGGNPETGTGGKAAKVSKEKFIIYYLKK